MRLGYSNNLGLDKSVGGFGPCRAGARPLGLKTSMDALLRAPVENLATVSRKWSQTSPNYCTESVQVQMPRPLPSSVNTPQSSAKSIASSWPRVESVSSSSV